MVVLGGPSASAASGQSYLRNASTNPPYAILSGPGVTSFGPFAGYVWHGKVTSIAASWRVPRVISGSHDGLAGTWIGAQAPGGKRAPFIQVGTNEGNEGVPGLPLRIQYAFFSDTKLSFHPSVLFEVGAGDVVAAQLRLTSERWHVAIVDRTNGHKVAFSTTDETRAAFNAAEWLQEDVTANTETGRLFPYPLLSTVRFTRLRVDSSAPTYASVSSQWMSENQEDLAPSSLIGDAFHLAPTQPTAIGTHYLEIAVALDVALHSFKFNVSRWTTHTSARAIASQQATLAAAMQANIQALVGTQWPTVVQPLFNQLVARTKVELAQTELAPTPTASGIGRWIAAWTRDYSAFSKTAHLIRRALKLPQLFPIPGEFF